MTPARHRLAAALVGALVALARSLPPGLAARAGAAVGLVAYALGARLRALGHANLARVYPAMPRAARAAVLRACGARLGTAGAEALAVAYGRRAVGDLVDVLPAARAALDDRARGVVLATGHVGNWELLGATLASLGVETLAVVRRPRNAAVAALVTALRARLGVAEIPRGPYAALHALRALRRGALVGLLCDQASEQVNAWVPFLGHPAPTPLGPATLARRSGAALVVAWLRRRGARHELVCERVAVGADDAATMAAVNAALGRAIAEDPPAWVWFHARWRAPEAQG